MARRKSLEEIYAEVDREAELDCYDKEDLKLKLTNNHYLIAECNDVLVGVQHISKLNRKSQTTLAVMGRDSISGSEQYCDMSQIPDISILDNLTNKKYPLSMYNIQPFYSNEIYIM